MIQWTIPAQFAVTSSAESVVTRSATNSDASSSSTYYSSGSTSWGPTGRTQYLSSSSSSQGTGPGSSDGTVINQTFQTTANVQTSTTQEFASGFFSTLSFEDTDGLFDPATFWTTTKTGSIVEFTETNAPQTVYTLDVTPERMATRDTTTFATETQTSALAATVIQADTRYAAEAEILYVLTAPPTTWSGFADATAIAQSATRTTIEPVFDTAATPVIAGTASTTSSVSNSAATRSTSWSASSTTQETITSVSNEFFLPPATETKTSEKVITTQSQTTQTVFAANTLTIGRVDAATTSSATTSVVTSYGTAILAVDRYAGTLRFESTAQTTFSATRYITTSVAATLNAISTTFNFAGNQTVYPEAQCSAQGIFGVGFNVGIPSRTRVITAGAVLGSQTGQYFTASFSTIVPTAFLGRGALTIRPGTSAALTVSGSSVTYTTSTAGDGTKNQATTASGLLSLSGSSSTKTEAFVGPNAAVSLGRPQHHGAHPVAPGCSIVDAMTTGAYRDRIGGDTSSFYGDATRFTQGESADIRYWSPIARVTPLELRGNRNAVTFSNRRNVPDTPPISSLNAW